MHVPINVKSPNNISEWQMGFNLAFKGLKDSTSASSGFSNKQYFFMSLTENANCVLSSRGSVATVRLI